MFGMDVDPNEILEGLKGASDFEVIRPFGFQIVSTHLAPWSFAPFLVLRLLLDY
jgi:hypothetical protein